MPEKSLPINEIVALNLAAAMEQAGLSQAALAEKAGVSQKTISNYLNPDQRAEGTTGKPPSPKLVELDAIGRVLNVPVWRLTRQMNDKEKALYAAIEKAYADLTAAADPEKTDNAGPLDTHSADTTSSVAGKTSRPGRGNDFLDRLPVGGKRNAVGESGRVQASGRDRGGKKAA